MAIKVKNGEHDYRKQACVEYCYMDSRFCPLHAKKVQLEIERWTDKEEGKKYKVNYVDDKKEPNMQTDNFGKGETDPVDVEAIEDFNSITDINPRTGDSSTSDGKLANELRFSQPSCYGDGSGFEYDIMSENIIGPSGSMEGIYDITDFQIKHGVLQLSNWNAWLDKYQTDYRFGRISDMNAETLLFPNVDDPWMFTEYVFKGSETGSVIVEPPLYDETTLALINPDSLSTEDPINPSSSSSSASTYVSKYGEQDKLYDENGNYKVKSYRKIANWDALNRDESARNNTNFKSLDAGIKLYKADINVESVKWGEHANIPPHTLNMSAPANWMDSTSQVSRIKSKAVAHIGTPLYAKSYGEIIWSNNEPYIYLTQNFTVVSSSGVKPYMTYDITQTPVKQDIPPHYRANNKLQQNAVKPNEILKNDGDLVQGGCQFLIGSSESWNSTPRKCKCDAMTSMDINDPVLATLLFGNNCTGQNLGCPKFVSGLQYPVIATYDSTAYNYSDYLAQTYGTGTGASATKKAWADNVLNNSTGLPMADMFVAMGVGAYPNATRPDIAGEVGGSVWYELTFETEYEDQNPVQLSQPTYRNYGKGVKILRGTGKMALDTLSNSNPFGGGDTNTFGDLDQLSFHRWFDDVMHCYNGAYCNDTYGKVNMTQGFIAGERAGGDGKCRYYRPSGSSGAKDGCGCPTGCSSKRAYEFQNTMELATNYLYALAEMWSLKNYSERTAYLADVTSLFIFEKDESTSVWTCYSKTDLGADYGGVNCVKDNNRYKLCKFLLFGSDIMGVYFWYQPLDDNGGIYGDKLWFCRCDKNFMSATYNCVIIDNDRKFIGGYHPQYKDYSKMGSEFIQQVDSTSSRDAMGDVLPGSEYSGIPQAVNTKGYWIDESGSYIMDERPIGGTVADDASRENPVGDCISFKKDNTTIDAETGERTAPKTLRCAVSANDPYALIYKFLHDKTRSENGIIQGRPMFEDPSGDGDAYYAPPIINNYLGLPTMRMASHCPVCDYYIAWKYHELLCPWCGTRLQIIEGNKGTGMDADSVWDSNASILRKFYKLNAIGKVQVWAPPGTCVHKDAYYWKNPAIVTNAITTQIKNRLGDIQNGSWAMNKMSAKTEFTLGYPEQVGTYIPVPNEVSKGKIYSDIAWTGVSEKEKSIYASYNDIIPKNPLLGFATDNMNEGLMIPYTTKSDDGLKIISLAELRALRNRIEPTLGYVSSKPSQGDYKTQKATYDLREQYGTPIYYSRGKCMIAPIILATTENGGDSFVQFWSGDPDWGTVREYYPPGYTWWMLNHLIGGKYSDLSGGQYHMDDTGFHAGADSCGHKVVSKAAMFLHGILPLDKEILKAYIIISPAGEPSKMPLGKGWNGHMHYEHYHAFKTAHYGDGSVAHLHGGAGFGGGSFDMDGNWVPESGSGIIYYSENEEVKFLDYGDYASWEQGAKPLVHNSWFDDKFFSQMSGLSGVSDLTFWEQSGTSKFPCGQGNLAGYGYENPSDPSNYSYINKGLGYINISSQVKTKIKFAYIYLNSNGDIVQKYSSNEIWKEKTVQQMQNLMDLYSVDVEFGVSDGTTQNSASYVFSQMAETMINDIIPKQTQSIPGYFNMSGINSTKRLNQAIDIKSKSNSGYEGAIIIQGENNEGVTYMADGSINADYSGSDENSQKGIVTRVIDVTNVVKNLYNERIDCRFYCDAGKSYKEIMDVTFPVPVYISASMQKWNVQITDDNFDGYLLTDTSSYPKTDSTGALYAIPSNGDIYDLAPSKIDFYGSCLWPITINSKNNKYSIILEEEKTESTIPSGKIYNIAGVISLLSTMLGSEFAVTRVNDVSYEVKQTGTKKSVTFNPIANSCYGTLGLVEGTYYSMQNRITTVTSYATGSHPVNLMGDESSSVWAFDGYEDKIQSFTADLARVPLLLEERSYRYNAPSIDCTNCYCPKEDCPCHDMMAGLWARQKGRVMSIGSTQCPSCGEDLSKQSGTVGDNGDGIKTYTYDSMFYEDAFITGIHIKPKYGCDYKVLARSNLNSGWTTLMSIGYDSNREKYIKYFPNIGDTFEESDTPFTDVAIKEENKIRARYVQVEVDVEPTLTEHEYDVKEMGHYKTIIKGNFSNMGLYTWGGVEVTFDNMSDTETANIVSTEVNADENEMTVYLTKDLNDFDATNATMLFDINMFTGGIDEFSVYGFHYKSTELTITDPADEQVLFITTNKSSYVLDDLPTQILSVNVGKNGSGGIELVEVSSKNALKWTTIQKKVVDSERNVYIIDMINGGNYYFDPAHNKIYIPTVNAEGKDWSKFESALDNKITSKTYFPSSLVVKYWSGNGRSITLTASAEKQGPAYQIEKDTITVIETPLPDNRESAKIVSVDGVVAKRKIPWFCYNHVQSTLSNSLQDLFNGSWMPPNFMGNELGASVDNDKVFVDLFGENCTHLRGRCTTEVTFYGAPNQIITGRIWVKAPAYTTKTISDGSGIITIKERTGGLKNGVCVVHSAPTACAGRKTLAYSSPTMIIYAKERNPADEF